MDTIMRSGATTSAARASEGAAACLHELFEAQADRTPAATALVLGDRSWTYSELDRAANRLARLLRSHAAGRGRLVGLYFERSQLPIIAILAVLKAGAAYLPIDPAHPIERVTHILGESRPALLLTDAHLARLAAARFAGTILVLDELEPELARRPDRRLARSEAGVAGEDLCYVLYTSGTTGRPKGVMTEHRQAVRYVHAFNEACGTGAADRVYQGFSLGFDGSVEEIWMAFSNGSALVLGSRDTPRFGDDLSAFLAASGVTYFSTVPTLLSTMTATIPTLRTLVLSGEACPPELVDRWAGGACRVLNVYGPTEATVNTTVAECRPGRPITIGKPLRGYRALILDEHLRPVPDGEKGELFIGGDTLARGYLGQPELTASRFMTVPLPDGPARLYRTGDVVRRLACGDLEFFGRIDGQIKIRGYRVELAEIESALREAPGVRLAVARLIEREGLQQLAAHVVLTDGAAALDRGATLALLRRRLPDYMIPAYLDLLDELPVLTSGKVDRSRLPEPIVPLIGAEDDIVAPGSALETQLAEAWGAVLGLPRVSVEANFFVDLGGHSLLAARLVTLLRDRLGLDAALRDLYRSPTIRQLAGRLAARAAETAGPETAPPVPTSRAVFEGTPRRTRWLCMALQALSLYVIYGLKVVPALIGLLIIWKTYLGEFSLLGGLLALVTFGLALMPLSLAIGIGAKWLIIGRYKPGRYPLWGSYYFRWWLVNRLTGFFGPGGFAGTPILSLYYRLMGAKVGRGCILDTAQVSAWDLISIGHGTSIGADTQLLGHRVEDGMLVLGRVQIGDRCFVGLHAALGLNVTMGDGARLDDQSLLPDGAVIPAGEGRRGSPAQPAEVTLPGEDRGAPEPVTWGRTLGLATAQLVGATLVGLMMLPLGLGLLIALIAAFVAGGWGWGCAAALALVPVSTLLYCLVLALLKRTILGRAAPGEYSIYSACYVRKWLADGLIRASRAALLPVYTTLYLPPFLRLLGARVGRRAELSTVWSFSPELLVIDDESFLADGCILGGRRSFGGRFQIGLNHVGRRSFVGNSALLPAGAGLGDGCLLGVLSAPPAGRARTPDGTEWLGVPAFALPNRPRAEGFGEEVTFRPTAKLYAQRALVDALRILIPGHVGMVTLIAGLLSIWVIYHQWGMLALVLTLPLISGVMALAVSLFVIGLKAVVMGRFEPVVKPLWSMYVWLNEMVNGAYESVMAPAIAPLLGTPFIVPLLRLMGCKIGKHTYIDSTLFSEWDLVEIGDYAALNVGSIIQTHLFEDRVMKSSHLKIGDECSVGNMSVVLYDTELGRGAVLAPLSLVMKGERLGPSTRWHGIPTVPLGHRAPASTAAAAR